MTNYLKEMNYKCSCPLCKKPINKREMHEDPKLQTIAEVVRRILNESYRLDPAGSAQQLSDTKKRKHNDLGISPQGTPVAKVQICMSR